MNGYQRPALLSDRRIAEIRRLLKYTKAGRTGADCNPRRHLLPGVLKRREAHESARTTEAIVHEA
jgi:hypothetical protein